MNPVFVLVGFVREIHIQCIPSHFTKQHPEIRHFLSENQNHPIDPQLIYHTLQDLLNYPVTILLSFSEPSPSSLPLLYFVVFHLFLSNISLKHYANTSIALSLLLLLTLFQCFLYCFLHWIISNTPPFNNR